MSEPCAIKDCKRASRTLCHCCNQNLCRDHFNQHDDLLNAQLNPLTDEINALADRLTAINIDKITSNSHEKLNQWRMDCHKIIDRFYEEKCREVDQYVNEGVNKQQKEIANLRSTMNRLIEKQETTKGDIDSLTTAIRHLKEKMSEIEQIFVQVDTHPLIIENSLIEIGGQRAQYFDLSNLPLVHTIHPIQTLDYELAANDQCLLVHVDGDLCLINEELSIVQQIKWDYDHIEDMCWSSVLEGFLVVTKTYILLVDHNAMSVKQIQKNEAEDYYACECSDESFYLSRAAWNSSVFEYSLLPSVKLKKTWIINDKSHQKQRVDGIASKHGTLALTINDQSIDAKLMELRLSETFSLLWSIQLDINYNSNAVRCCRLNYDEWLLADWSTSRLFHVNHEGKIKKTITYKATPCNIICFRSNILVILTTGCINFHKL